VAVRLRLGLRVVVARRVVVLERRVVLERLVVARRLVVRGLLTRALGRLADERRTLCEDRFGAASAVSTTTPPNNNAHKRVNGMRGLRSP